MNKLEIAIQEQYKRVEVWDSNPGAVLDDARAEIMSVATPELTEEIICDARSANPLSSLQDAREILGAIQVESSLFNRTTRLVREVKVLARVGVFVPRQGYIGGILSDGDELRVFGHSLAEGIKADDPIQQSMGETFYPPMMWAKALRGVAYNNRPKSARNLSAAEYMAKLGLTLGCEVTEYGDVIGATGFMPGSWLEALAEAPAISAHMQTEPIEVFRLSGLCDQAVVQPGILRNTKDFALKFITAGGNLN